MFDAPWTVGVLAIVHKIVHSLHRRQILCTLSCTLAAHYGIPAGHYRALDRRRLKILPSTRLSRRQSPFLRDEFHLLRLVIAVVEEEFVTGSDRFEGEDPDPMISVDHQHFGATIGSFRMVGESDEIADPCRIHYLFVVETEEIATLLSIIDLASSLTLLLTDHFTTILRNEFILLDCILRETSPSCHF